MLKKLLVLLPALALMLAIVSPVRAAAYEYPAISDPAPEYTVEQLMPEALEYDNYFMFFEVGNYWNNYSIICFNNADAVIETDETGKIYIYSVDSSISFPVYSFRQSGSNAPSSAGTSWKNRYYFIIDFNTNNIKSYINYQPNDFSSHFVPSGGNSSDTNFTAFENGISSVVNPGLKVEVSFTPELSGEVDRSSASDSSYTSQSFTMSVVNKSRSNIQYSMSIYSGDALVFKYISTEWTYGKLVGTLKQLKDQTKNFSEQHKGTYWHWVGAGSSTSQTFKWSQIDFHEDQFYTVIVEAVPTSLDKVSEFFSSRFSEGASLPEYVLDSSAKEVVFTSTFSINDLSDVVYNPNDVSNGVIPNSSTEDINRAVNNRDALVKDDGTIDYTSYNAYDDPDSALNTYGGEPGVIHPDDSSIVIDSGVSGASVGGASGISYSGNSFSSLSGTVSGFFGFLRQILGYLPSAFTTLLFLGFVSLVVLGIVKKI